MLRAARFLLLLAPCLLQQATAQTNGGYKTPPAAISDMLLAKKLPALSINPTRDWLLLLESSDYPSVEELAKPELKIAGLRINPTNFSASRTAGYTNLYLRNLQDGKDLPISGLPKQLKAIQIRWSASGKKFAFVHISDDRADLYTVDITTHKATRINRTPLNLVLGSYSWIDDQTIIYPAIVKPAQAAPPRPTVPAGPTVQENTGKASPRPTFQDLIKSPYDESLFAFYGTSQLMQYKNGVESKVGAPAIYFSINRSPDSRFLLVRTLSQPFSYAVPAGGFASTYSILDRQGKTVKVLAEIPSLETAPAGNDNLLPVPRAFDWRDDEPATITWCEPRDSGLIKKIIEYHDAVYALAAPFTDKPTELFKTKMRFRGITWGHEGLAIVTEGLTSKQLTQTDRYNPVTGDLEKLLQRNTTDAYSSTGAPVTELNKYGKEVLLTTDNGNKIIFNNTTGSSPQGDMPFLLSFDVHTKKRDTLWRCSEGWFEYVAAIVDAGKLQLLTERQNEKTVPNYWLKNLRLRIADRQLTFFTNPYPQMEGVKKEKIRYKRADGVDLTGELFLPAGYNPAKDGKLPVFIWAYPAEYNSAADAAQIRGSEHKFPMLNWGSPVFYVTQGYAVLNNAEMPIVAKDKSTKPNDNFIEQLTLNAEAAIRTLDSMGVGDKNRVAVGGHSYGAFMTANLLAHTNLFKAGIARSGAYNRSLTPFGFQNEDRTYWEATSLYNEMSPFNYADKIKTPLMLIHGEMDNNTGTFPIQSERMYNAIKGHGGTARYITLPFESHGYQGKENILHMLAEQMAWLDKYVKNAPASTPVPATKGF